MKYVKLQYIESTGTQYINTLIKPSTADTKIECEAMYMGGNSSANLFGIRTGGSSSRDFYQFNKTGTANQYRWICGKGGDAYFTNTNLTEKTKLLFEGNKCYINDVLIVTSGSSNSGADLFLFARNNAGVGVDQYGSWRLYSFKIYKNNELVRDFIPVKTMDGVICLYDLISKTFYVNSGSGSFIAGPEISELKLLKINGLIQPKINGKKVFIFNNTPTHYDFDFSSFYTIIDYIEGTGTQWIDTGIQPTTSTKIATKCSFSVDGGNVFIGATDLPDNNDFRIFRASGQYLYFDRGSGRLQNSLSLNTVYELEFGNWYMKIDGQTVQSGNAFNISLSSSTIKVMPTTNADYGKIYYLKIYDGDTLVRDFVPVIRNVDNKIGLYDKTTKQFFTNQGTGEFLGGGIAVNYNILNYIELTGTQYINTTIAYLQGATQYGFYLDFEPTEVNFSGNSIYSVSSGSVSTESSINENGLLYYKYGGNQRDISTLTKNNRYVYEVDHRDRTLKITLNGDSKSYDQILAAWNEPLYLGYRKSGGYGKFKIYEFKIYKADVLVQHLIPVQRKTDKEIGMYDKVTNTLFSNAGTGTFIGG